MCEKCTEWNDWTVEKLRKSFYVDNCVASVDIARERDKFIGESTNIVRAGRFHLHGWEYTGDESDKESSLVLELLWNKRNDTLAIIQKGLSCPRLIAFSIPLA